MIIAVGFKVNNERAVQFRKWANAIVKDYVQSKHVDYEINNVEAGGIGIQFVNGKQTTIKPPSSPNGRTTQKKKSSHFLVTRTFIYRYNNARPEDSRRLPLLFQFLTKEQRTFPTLYTLHPKPSTLKIPPLALVAVSRLE